LDGIDGFLKGERSEVTNNIGLTINGIAKAGIIHKPFFVHSGNTSRTYLGTVETGAYSTTN